MRRPRFFAPLAGLSPDQGKPAPGVLRQVCNNIFKKM